MAPIGDTLFATPAIRALRRAYPNARLSALVFPTNRAVLQNNPDVDELIVHATRETWPGWRAFIQFFAARRREGYDLAVHFAPYHDYYRLLAAVPNHLRLSCPWLHWLIRHRNQRWRRMHAIDHYLDVLRPLGLPAPDRELVLKLSGQQEAFAERYLHTHGYRKGELLVGIHAGGAGFRGMKRWSPAGFAWVASQLRQHGPVRLLFFGSAEERQLAAEVACAGHFDGCIDACGRTTLGETIGLLGRLDLFIGNDSGPLHLAAALGTPSVGVFGPTNLRTYHPQGPLVRVVAGTVPCPANYGFIGTSTLWQYRECRGECLASIDPADVYAAAAELLEESNAVGLAL
ncbi:MAG: glycosyltransferase family 9 protein [Chloroflexota bacterium]|nr:glycosyltransferase family 9 protein [Chloroflexota bacterium]